MPKMIYAKYKNAVCKYPSQPENYGKTIEGVIFYWNDGRTTESSLNWRNQGYLEPLSEKEFNWRLERYGHSKHRTDAIEAPKQIDPNEECYGVLAPRLPSKQQDAIARTIGGVLVKWYRKDHNLQNGAISQCIITWTNANTTWGSITSARSKQLTEITKEEYEAKIAKLQTVKV